MYACADIHGNFTGLFKCLLKKYENCKVFVAGDCGFGFYKFNFYKNLFNRYDEQLRFKNITVYFIRGNHDDPKYFTRQLLKFNNLILLQDYEKVDNILVIGGAISIDRMFRVDNEDYWKDERVFKKEEIEFLYNSKIDFNTENVNINIIISHEAPKCANPIIEKVDIQESILKDIEEGRNILQNVFEEVKPKKWFYGHYHKYKDENINDCNFVCMKEFKNNEIYEI